MFSLTKMDHHLSLLHRMRRVTWADLGAALERGALAPEGLRAAMLRCANCACPEACAGWLDAREGADPAAGHPAAPGYCRNEALLGRLAGG